MEEQQELTEEIDVKKKKEEDEEEGSLIGGLLFLALVGVAIWALFHFNPSEEDHRDAISEVVADATVDMMADGYYMTGGTMLALSNIKYHSLGICSWTATKYRGSTALTSIGILGWVYPIIRFE